MANLNYHINTLLHIHIGAVDALELNIEKNITTSNKNLSEADIKTANIIRIYTVYTRRLICIT